MSNWGKSQLAMRGDSANAQSMFSNIQGISYFSDSKVHWSERVWWIIGLSLYLWACSNPNILVKCDTIPEFSSFTGKSSPVWAIPFPSVTICPETKTYMGQLNFTDVWHTMLRGKKDDLTKEDLSRMQSVYQLCDAHLAENFKFGQEFATNEIYDIIKGVAPNFKDTMFYCKWRNTFSSCSKKFQSVLTEEGLCYTFNALNSRDIYTNEMADDMMIVTDNPNATNWNLEDGYSDGDGNYSEIYPYRVFGAGARAGLFTLLRLYEQDLDYVCRGPIQGFKILLHTPGEVPQVSKHYFRVPLLREVLVRIKPQMVTTSEKLRDYSPNQRQCYFNSERQLRFFKLYTQRNCELECLSNFTKIACGCVKFSMPRDNNTPICGADKIKCFNEAEDALLKENFIRGVQNIDSVATGCNCLPACTSITYDAEISQAEFDWIGLFNAFKNPLDEFPGMQPSRLSIYFKEHSFITLKRSKLNVPTEFNRMQEFDDAENENGGSSGDKQPKYPVTELSAKKSSNKELPN